MTERSKRQSFLGANSDIVLAQACVGVVGLGGGGSHVVQQLAHVGVGNFVFLDPDSIEDSNLNRLVGGTRADVRRKALKVNIARRIVRRLNDKARIHVQPVVWQERADLLRTCDIIIGCVDSFVGRAELERAARRCLTPYLDIGMDVHETQSGYSITGQVALSMPGEACLWCMNVVNEASVRGEAEAYGAAGGRPQVVWPNGILASVAVGVAVQLLTPWTNHPVSARLWEYDGNNSEIHVSSASEFIAKKQCPHFLGEEDLGDPWFRLSQR